MEFKSKNPQEFWEKNSKVTKQERNIDILILPENLRTYFKSLLDSPDIDPKGNLVSYITC